MTDYFKPTNSWIEMALEIIEFAKKKSAVDDFKHFCEMQYADLEKNYPQRMKVLSFLLRSKIVLLRDKKLALGNLNKADWIEEGLKNGNTNIWKFANFVHPESPVIKKFDSDQLAEIGMRGEKFVIEILKSKIPPEHKDRIQHVSLIDDTLGYDIQSPSLKNLELKVCLEIKTTVKQDYDFGFFLSKNEYYVSQNRIGWHLVLVRVSNEKPSLLGHIKGGEISGLMPEDSDKRVTWQTVKIKVDPSWIIPDLP